MQTDTTPAASMSAPAGTARPTRRVLGVDFHIGTLGQAVDRALAGGLMVAPSAPGLAMDLVKSPSYRRALTTADLAITDSGFMVMLWRLFTGEKLPRQSGLLFIRAVLAREDLKAPGAIFWVMPSAEEDERNRAWLTTQGFAVTPDDVHIAPRYPATGDIDDPELVQKITVRTPRLVVLGIGGGVQERLGLHLREALRPQHPGILCIGAAIAFLTGGQTNIPPWADRLVLGWLFRLVSSPRKFWRRYYEAFALAPLLWRCRDRLPGRDRRPMPVT